jgi:hypothetical protein
MLLGIAVMIANGQNQNSGYIIIDLISFLFCIFGLLFFVVGFFGKE